MDSDKLSQRLSRITTLWTLVEQAHAGQTSRAPEAQRLLMQRYYRAVCRYLLGALRDEDAALELSQEFAVRFLRGDFRKASAEHGRFRDYVKASLRNLVTDYHRQRQAHPQPLPADVAAPAGAVDDDEFLASWRAELLGKTWEALAEAQPTLHAVLRAHAQNRDAPATQLAEELTTELGKPVTTGNVRVMLHRARTRFAELLVAEVAHSLGSPTEAQLLEELRALRLLKLCGPALERRDGDEQVPRDGG